MMTACSPFDRIGHGPIDCLLGISHSIINIDGRCIRIRSVGRDTRPSNSSSHGCPNAARSSRTGVHSIECCIITSGCVGTSGQQSGCSSRRRHPTASSATTASSTTGWTAASRPHPPLHPMRIYKLRRANHGMQLPTSHTMLSRSPHSMSQSAVLQ